MAQGTLKYSISRPQELRRTTKFSRKDLLGEEEGDIPAPTQPIRVMRDDGDDGDTGKPAAAAPARLQFGKHELTIERWGDHVSILLPGAVRLVGTRDQVTVLIAALTSTAI